MSSLVPWGGINLALHHWVPVLVAGGLAVGVAAATGATTRVGSITTGRWASR